MKNTHLKQEYLISLVICTRNRASFLPQHLDSLRQIKTENNWEIIFVDNNSNDETAVTLNAFAQQSRVPVTVVCEKKIGLSNARNAGWVLAKGEIVAFTDDDCYPAENFIDEVSKVFEDKKMGFTGGRVLLHDPEDIPWTIKLSEDVHYYNPYSFIGPGNIHGANFAIRKSLLEAIGGFDTLMGSGTPFPCEDCDVLLRALRAGSYGVYAPSIVVSHHHRRRMADLPKIERAYLAGRGAFFVKAFVDAKYRLPVVYEWMRSLKCFGVSKFFSELYIGMKYIQARKNFRSITK